MRVPFSLSLALASFAFAAPALADDDVTIRVPYSAADLTSDEGLEKLGARVAEAARAACAATDDAALSFNRVADCQDELVRKARGQIEALRTPTPDQ